MANFKLLGSAAGQFVTADYSPKMKIGDFYIFPYDVRHVVYPFTNKKAKRRTLVCNVDVEYNPVASRTAGMIFEPKWKSLMANTTAPIFSPAQCQDIINMGHQQKAEEAKVGHKDGKGGKHDTKKRITTISWIPFKASARHV